MQRYNIELKPPKTKMENTLLSIFALNYFRKLNTIDINATQR